MSEFSIELAQSILDSNQQFPIDLEDAWQWLGYSRKDSAKRALVQNFERDSDFHINVEATTTGISAIPAELIYISIDCFKMLAMLAKTDVGKVARKYFLECEKIAKEKHSTKPKTRRELAEENLKLVIELEEKEALIASLEEDVERQAEVIDELFDYSSIIRVAKYNGVPETTFNWRVLKVASTNLQIEIKKVPCPRFGTKNLYSHDAWRLAYPGFKLPETTTLVIKPQ